MRGKVTSAGRHLLEKPQGPTSPQRFARRRVFLREIVVGEPPGAEQLIVDGTGFEPLKMDPGFGGPAAFPG